jgi:hypothetical protein
MSEDKYNKVSFRFTISLAGENYPEKLDISLEYMEHILKWYEEYGSEIATLNDMKDCTFKYILGSKNIIECTYFVKETLLELYENNNLLDEYHFKISDPDEDWFYPLHIHGKNWFIIGHYKTTSYSKI